MDRATRQEQTRTRLLDAAAEVFARSGFHAATVDDVAEAAGYTKGAVYSNFANKDALFIALLDRHLDRQFDQLDQLFETDTDHGLHDALQHETERAMRTGTRFGLLTMEFWLYAMRNPVVREQLAARYDRMRRRLAELIGQRRAARDVAPGRSPDDQAALVLALDAGLFLQQLADPGAIDPTLRSRALTELLDPAGADDSASSSGRE